MMAFEYGTPILKRESPVKRRCFSDAAVLCWFTSKGRAIPLLVKLQEGDEIIKLQNIKVHSLTEQFYAGIQTWEYECSAYDENKEYLFLLQYFPENKRWKIEKI
ncbi:hypothetical protein [Lachnoclostridium sp. An181]|uniref:hypothetical protein n=1 Tax=Lachnoclostridium sp. An181 TaxID=1965575 RepID=UPI001179F11D|nr:hypothetical protein [Lachnoclostridium sp. An181]